MPIDLQAATSAVPTPFETSWGVDDVILYHLGIGAGWQAPCDLAELEYTYEESLKVLPSFAVVPAFPALELLQRAPGLSIDMAKVLHGSQELVLHGPLPAAAAAVHTPRIAAIWDKGKAAIIVIEVDTADADGRPLCTNRFSVFARGEGGFGGEPGPSVTTEPPSRAPDLVVESPTMPHQALLYRLSGDKNPLHADPRFAEKGGFDRPILHGLCSFGVACKAVVDGLLDGDVGAVRRYAVRFSGVVFPGETLVTSMWRDGNEIRFQTATRERGTPVLSSAVVEVR